MKRKGILVCTEFPPLPGGIGNHAYNLAEQLSDNGYEMMVLTNSRNQKEEKLFEKDLPFKVLWINRSSLVFLTYFKRAASYARLLKGLGATDTLIVSGKFSLFLLAIFGKRKSGTCVAVIHGTELQQGKPGKFLIQKALNRSTHVISVSSFTQKRLHAFYAVEERKSKVINNGFRSQNLPLDVKQLHAPLRLITVGNLTARKGQQNVIKALPTIMEQLGDVVYHVIGLPTNLALLKQLAEELNVADRVIFHGLLDNEERDRLLSSSDVFMMLSAELDNGDFEGFGIAILEAGEFGLPAIGTLNSGIADAISNGETGELVHPEDPAEIALALARIKNNYLFYSRNAIENSKTFSWDKVIGKYLRFIENA